MNTGEEICGESLRHVRKCEFVQHNLKPPDVRGEIDVAREETKELDSSVVRFLQIEEHLRRHLKRLDRGEEC